LFKIIFQIIEHVQADKTSLLAELLNMIGSYFINPINHIQTLGYLTQNKGMQNNLIYYVKN